MSGGEANPVLRARELGQHVWLDNLSRALLRDTLPRLIAEDGVDGVTTNPSILHKAITSGEDYAADLQRLRRSTPDAEARYEALAIADVRAACALLRGEFKRSAGDAGYVSLEVSPALADDADGTVQAGRRLHAAVGCENLLIKVPATAAGLEACARLLASGISVNVTLIFSPAQFSAVTQAFIEGAQRYLASGGAPTRLRSVASVFLSRIDTLVDAELEQRATPEALALRGRAGVALAVECYCRHREAMAQPRYQALLQAGMRPQTPLWASTGTKNPAYSDLMYVEPLVGPGTITTLPDDTLAALRDHGRVSAALAGDPAPQRAHLVALAAQGLDLDVLGVTLQHRGVGLFATAYSQLLGAVA